MTSSEEQEGPSGQPDTNMADPPMSTSTSMMAPEAIPTAVLSPAKDTNEPVAVSTTPAPEPAMPPPPPPPPPPPSPPPSQQRIEETEQPPATQAQPLPHNDAPAPETLSPKPPPAATAANETPSTSAAQDHQLAPAPLAPSGTANGFVDLGTEDGLAWAPSLWRQADGGGQAEVPAANHLLGLSGEAGYYDALSQPLPLYPDLLAQASQPYIPNIAMANYAFANVGAAAEQPFPLDEDEEEDYEHPPNVYGKLEFPDSTTWITTRTVLIGRDQKIFLRARKERAHRLKVEEHIAKGLPPPTPPRAAGTGGRGKHHPKSFASEEGGALGPESDGEDNPRPAKRRKTAAGERTVEQQARKTSGSGHSNTISSRQYVDYAPGPGDVTGLKSQDEIAHVRIHGEGPDMWASTKGISREHLKISYDAEERVWKGFVLGRNGVFCRSVHHKEGDVFTLYSGDELQIQYITIQFYLAGVEDGKTGAELQLQASAPASRTYSENGKEMSFDFQSSRGDEMHDTDDSSEAEEGQANLQPLDSDDSDDSDEAMEDAPEALAELSNADGDDEIRETVESDAVDGSLKPESSPDDVDKLSQLGTLPPKKRGPGRPPKNGIMSKREERLLKKQAAEEAKRNMPPQEPGDQPQKRKVGRPRKHPLPEGLDGQGEKRKYKPRRPKGEDGEEELDGDKPAKEKSMKHKTPPLELKREDFTEEQLQKPTKNYQLLIDEIMTAAPPKGYSLKQVYKRIQERWPYFYFCVDTKGWESSVRHNLLGSECFKKIEGNWHRVPGVPLESGKKRKPSDSIAEPRPTGMYNGYSHPYQPPMHPQHHIHHPTAHSTALTPNLPPRYPPNGQAYQIHQGPPSNNNGTAQLGAAPTHQHHGPPRPAYPQHHQAPGAQPQTNGYTAAATAPRPQHPGAQVPPYNPAYANRPQPPPHVANHSPAGAGPNAAPRPPLARPGQGPPLRPQQGPPAPPTMHPASNASRPAPSTHQILHPAQNSAPAAPLGPVIEPFLRLFIREFRAEVIKQLQAKEGKRSEVVAMSVINRGLGLTEKSLVPELESYEKLILNVFRQHKQIYPKRRAEEAAKAAASAASVPMASTKAAAVNGSSPMPSTAARMGAPHAHSPGLPAPNGNSAPPPPAAATAAARAQPIAAKPVSGSQAVGGTSGATKAGSVNSESTLAHSTVQKPASAGGVPPNAPTNANPGIPSPVGTGPKTGAPSGVTPGAPTAAAAIPAPPAPAAAPPTAATGVESASLAPGPRPATHAATTIGGGAKAPDASPSLNANAPTTPAAAPPTAVSAEPVPITTAATTTIAPKPVASSLASSMPASTASTAAPVGPVQTKSTVAASVAPKVVSSGTVSPAPATSTSLPPGFVPAASVPEANPTGSGAPKPVSATAAPSTPSASTAPTTSVAAASGSGPAAPASRTSVSGLPRPVAATATVTAPTTRQPIVSSPAMGAANSAPPKPAGMVGTPGTNSPASNGARPTSATPGPSATPEGSREVELLDPKLVNVILSFKKSILPTLAEKLDPLLGESLIMSAVDRLLGFTDDTFVQSKSEQQKQHFAEAEKALMKHLETRFGEYVRNRSAQR